MSVGVPDFKVRCPHCGAVLEPLPFVAPGVQVPVHVCTPNVPNSVAMPATWVP